MDQKKNVVELDLSPEHARRILNQIVTQSERVFFTSHAEERMAERQITRTQILRCLEHGTFTEGPYRDIKGNWKFTLETLSAGDPLAVVAALDKDNKGNYVVVITTYT